MILSLGKKGAWRSGGQGWPGVIWVDFECFGGRRELSSWYCEYWDVVKLVITREVLFGGFRGEYCGENDSGVILSHSRWWNSSLLVLCWASGGCWWTNCPVELVIVRSSSSVGHSWIKLRRFEVKKRERE